MTKINYLLFIFLAIALASCDSDGGDSGGDTCGQIGSALQGVDIGQTEFNLENAFPDFSFSRPLDIQNAGDCTFRLFVVEQRGVIHVLFNVPGLNEAKILNKTQVFLDLKDRVFFNELQAGMLSLAFHPDYGKNGFFYVSYMVEDPLRNVISRFTLSAKDPNEADPNSELILLEILQPGFVHNVEQLVFGLDHYLYISVGDGGSISAASGASQDLSNLLGKILRIDVDEPKDGKNYGIPTDNPFIDNNSGIREEIYAYGFRNPWRISFDPVNGDLWAGDNGENSLEEVDIVEKGKNYGWNIMEGTSCFDPPSDCDMTGIELPIWEYGRDQGASVIGGFVYRGLNVPELIGSYIYADFVSGGIWALQIDELILPVNTEIIDFEKFSIVSFGTDENHELYIASFDGNIYRFVPTVNTSE